MDFQDKLAMARWMQYGKGKDQYANTDNSLIRFLADYESAVADPPEFDAPEDVLRAHSDTFCGRLALAKWMKYGAGKKAYGHTNNEFLQLLAEFERAVAIDRAKEPWQWEGDREDTLTADSQETIVLDNDDDNAETEIAAYQEPLHPDEPAVGDGHRNEGVHEIRMRSDFEPPIEFRCEMI